MRPEDWSFIHLGEHYLLRRLYQRGSIVDATEYRSLRRRWNTDANRIGLYAHNITYELFKNLHVDDDHCPGDISHDLGLVDFERGEEVVLTDRNLEAHLPIRLTDHGELFGRLVFARIPDYETAILLIFYLAHRQGYFVRAPAYGRASFFGGLLGLTIFQVEEFANALIKKDVITQGLQMLGVDRVKSRLTMEGERRIEAILHKEVDRPSRGSPRPRSQTVRLRLGPPVKNRCAG